MLNKKTAIPFTLSFILLMLISFSCNQLPTEADALKKNQEGINLLNEGKYEPALVAFKEAIANPRLTKLSRGTVYRNISLTYQELMKRDSAVHYATLSAKCYRKNSYDYLVNMATVDLLTGKTKAAMTRLLKAAAMNPEDLGVNNILGLIYLGDYGEEFADPQKALPYNKKAFEAKETRATEDVLGRNYYAVGDYELAEYHYEKIDKKYPGVLIYKLNIGMIKYKLKKKTEAELMFAQVIAMDSSYKPTIELFKSNNR